MHGIDAAAASVEIARLHASRDPVLSGPGGRLRYSCATAESLLGRGELYDVVCSLEVVEHVTHAPSFLHTLAALVKPGGVLVVSTMNQTNKSWLQAIVGAGHDQHNTRNTQQQAPASSQLRCRHLTDRFSSRRLCFALAF